MSEYIDKNEAVDEGYLQDWYISSVSEDDEPVWTEAHIEELAKDFIVIPKDTPGSDVVPVVHGEWRDQYNDFTNAKCSCCGAALEVMIDGEANRLLWDGFKQFYKFCPNCGAKMDGGMKHDKP